MKNKQTLAINRFILENGKSLNSIALSYQSFGLPVGTAPVIVVNHSITGNSNSGGKKGWWKSIIGDSKAIDTSAYTIITFAIPGMEMEEDSGNEFSNYRDFTIRDVANLFWEGLFTLKINSLFAVIGGELGGAIAWEMAALQPNRIENLIPIASHWQSTDSILATVLLQEQLLTYSEDPLVDARYHANLSYKNSNYVNQLFKRSNLDTQSIEIIEKCLLENDKDQIKRYRMMNYMMKSHDVSRNRTDLDSIIKAIKAKIYMIGIETTAFATAEEDRNTTYLIHKNKSKVSYQEIRSEYGPDAYVREAARIATILQPILKSNSAAIQNQLQYYSGNYMVNS